MKFSSFLVFSLFFVGWAAQAQQSLLIERDVISCVFEGESLKKHLSSGGQWNLPSDTVALEYRLVENFKEESKEFHPTFLQIKRFSYGADGVAQAFQGAPLSRVGYSELNGVITFSYSNFVSGSTHPFHISTDGKTSTFSYVQSSNGWKKRGFQFDINCNVLGKLNTQGKPVILSGLSKQTQVNLIREYGQLSSSSSALLSTVLSDAQANKLKNELNNFINSYDIESKTGTDKYEWENNQKGCDIELTTRYVKKSQDYVGTLLGYTFYSFQCKNKLVFLKPQFDKDTGKPIEPIRQVQHVYLQNIILDALGDIANIGVEENKLEVSISKW